MSIRIRQFLVMCAMVCLIVSGVFFYKAYDVKTNYYNSEDFYSLNENAYVGGDAYNYIINGTYFTGYSVIGSAFLIGGILFITCCVNISYGLNLKEKNTKIKDIGGNNGTEELPEL